ncbi:dihydroxyacetone kinase subunit DhaL [Amphibacillus sp. MSJ-3]|uniref:dihydroxyacetone kinase subunit DhaL n=1 Tax=Amphibacillus sp. MSJ-3 TaxID=2841505 RepID=UPI00352FFD18
MMLTTENTVNWLTSFGEKVIENKAYLSELDSLIGDGDHGSNMARGVQAMLEKFQSTEFKEPNDVFKTTAMALLSKIGGASGPLYGSAFMEMAKQSETGDISVIISAGLDGIKKRGRAEPGEKTMIDVWVPVCEALQENQLTKQVIDEAVQATKPMKATKGRASYVGDRSIGEIDPGAMSSAYLFEALLEGDILND